MQDAYKKVFVQFSTAGRKIWLHNKEIIKDTFIRSPACLHAAGSRVVRVRTEMVSVLERAGNIIWRQILFCKGEGEYVGVFTGVEDTGQ